MFTKIAVPLDGSVLAEEALPFAIRLAKQLDARLMLLRAVEVPILIPATPDHEFELVQEAEEYLAEVYKTLCDPSLEPSIDPDKLQSQVVYGEKAREIAEIAPLEKADLIVMTTHGRTGLSRLLLGSTAIRILQHSNLPVVLIHPTGTDNAQSLIDTLDEPTTLDKAEGKGSIVVTLDGTPESEAALTPAIELARKLGTGIQLVQVIIPPAPVEYATLTSGYVFVEASEIEALRNEASEYLQRIKAEVEGKGINCEPIILTGEPATTITEFAQKANITMLVMATHARGNVGRFLMGSVAETVMSRSHLPVLMVHPYGYARATETVKDEQSTPLTTV